jgi:hypothetical protein
MFYDPEDGGDVFLRTTRHYNPLKNQGSACYLLHAGFLLGSFFGPEDIGRMLFRNIG